MKEKKNSKKWEECRKIGENIKKNLMKKNFSVKKNINSWEYLIIVNWTR